MKNKYKLSWIYYLRIKYSEDIKQAIKAIRNSLTNEK